MQKEREKEMDMVQHDFIKTLLSDFGNMNINDQIENWYRLDWSDFKHELQKQNVRVEGSAARDWREYFKLQKSKMSHLIEQ